MATPGSFLSNAVTRRRQLNSTRRLLTLGERGMPQPQRPTPPVVPADRPNQQQEAVQTATTSPPQAAAPQGEEEDFPRGDGAMMAKVAAFLSKERMRKLEKIRVPGSVLPNANSPEGMIHTVREFYNQIIPGYLEVRRG